MSTTIAGVVLAAGFSRRLGRAKQAVVLGQQTLLERAVASAAAAQLEPVIAVVRPDLVLPHLGDACIVINQQAEEGIASSIRAGVAAAEQANARGVVLMTCDQPAVTAEHLRQLCAQDGVRSGSAYGGRCGVPAYFPAADFAVLLRLRGDHGARDLLAEARQVVLEPLALDIDTEADLQRARRIFT